MPEPAPLHPASRRYLDMLTDEVGIFQHAIGSRPDPAHGYCTDDVARALQVDLLHGRELGWKAVAPRARRNLRFLAEAFDPSTGRFRNFRSVDGRWRAGDGSEDCQGRALHALGDVIAAAPDGHMVEAATSLFARALPAAMGVNALRARASVLLACLATLDVPGGPVTVETCRDLAAALGEQFDRAPSSAWPWPEPRLTYENGLPPRALIAAGRALASESLLGVGLRVLDWLIDAQTEPDGHLSPIGNGWWQRGTEKARFDQQPIEATSLLLAAEAAYRAGGRPRHRAAMERAYAWFLGANDLGLRLADPVSGACADGLTPTGINMNQGAESTLMWLTAAEHLRALRRPAAAGAGRAGRSDAIRTMAAL